MKCKCKNLKALYIGIKTKEIHLTNINNSKQMCLKGSKESIINIKENINEWMQNFISFKDTKRRTTFAVNILVN